MNIPKTFRVGFVFRCSTIALVVSIISCWVARATPYASGLTNNAGTVSFILNEDADDVKIIFGGTTNSIGAQLAGLITTNVSASNPFSVQVTKTSGAGYKTAVGINAGLRTTAGKIQISTDPLLSRFPTPRGVAVNKNPASPFFGRVYVANSTPLVVAGRSVGRGLYTLNADFSDSPNGYGDTAQTGGLTFAVSANSPYRLSVGEDDRVYIADFSDANGNVYRTDGNLLNGEWVFDWVGGPATVGAPTNHGSTLKAVAEGSLATSDLKIYTVDEDYNGVLNNDVWRYDINSGPLTNQNAPTLISSALIGGFSVINDICKGGTNKYLYLMQNRVAAANPAAASSALFVVDTNGTTLASALTLWRNYTGISTNDNVLTNLNSIAISPDGNYLAGILQSAAGESDTYIIPLTNGIPNLPSLKILDTGTIFQGRGVDFDAAGNIYTVSSGDTVLRSFSPGGFTIATTGSSGSFNVFSPAPTSPTITTNQLINSGTQVQIDFSSSNTLDTEFSFKLQSSALVTGPYLDDNTAVVVSTGTGTFSATANVSGDTRFYRIRNF